MTVNPTLSGPPVVAPVVDYEPPAHPVPAHRPRRPVPVRLGRRRDRPPPERPARVPLAPVPRTAAMFADTTLRRVLEVIDRRRPATHLYPLLTAGLVDSLRSRPGALPAGGGTEAAALHRLRLQPIESGGAPSAVEVSGSYRRGRRLHALACRIERVPAGAGPGWQIVALDIG